MYLSLINIKQDMPNNGILNNPYKTHQALWEAFGGGKRDFLFRTEKSIKNHSPWKIYLLSERNPDFKRMGQKASLSVENYAAKEFKPQLVNHQSLKFYLRANPTVKQNKKRHPLVHEDKLYEWIKRKGKENGFLPYSVSLMNKNKYISYRGKEKPPITHCGIDFEGILEIHDCDLFRQSLIRGLGSAKAFGFGLMTIMRP
ncbi:MAG: type I-E CRISPR-associated protein Cas6/Cse3/CasE [bacterium]|nr:MAG: type I-E CRISPR-associated protein Cas6/Cse3/CasE [bacterium]